MPKKLPELQVTYHYQEPKTPEEKAEAERNVTEAYGILFKEVERQQKEFEKLLEVVKAQFKLDINGDHGISHWRRVKRIGLQLVSDTDADWHVVSLFSAIHDACREDEHDDPDHGNRAAELAVELHGRGLLEANDRQLTQLVLACRNHSIRDFKTDDITVQTCLDADRLDLYRLGEVPDDKYLFGDQAKHRKTRDFVLRLLNK